MLTKDELLASYRGDALPVTLPGDRGEVFVRPLRLAEKILAVEGWSELSRERQMARIFRTSVCDPGGSLLFSIDDPPADADELQALHDQVEREILDRVDPVIIERVFNKYLDLSGLAEDAKKNSPSSPNSDSPAA